MKIKLKIRISREKKLMFEEEKNYFVLVFSFCNPQSTHGFLKNMVSPFGPTVWPVIANIIIQIIN